MMQLVAMFTRDLSTALSVSALHFHARVYSVYMQESCSPISPHRELGFALSVYCQ